jgi:DNA-binding IclR family transcriptional regulator
MACVNPDGTLSTVAARVLERVAAGADERDIAASAGVPVYRVRASLRELVQAGLLSQADGAWTVTEAGRAAAARAGAG